MSCETCHFCVLVCNYYKRDKVYNMYICDGNAIRENNHTISGYYISDVQSDNDDSAAEYLRENRDSPNVVALKIALLRGLINVTYVSRITELISLANV